MDYLFLIYGVEKGRKAIEETRINSIF